MLTHQLVVLLNYDHNILFSFFECILLSCVFLELCVILCAQLYVMTPLNEGRIYHLCQQPLTF